MSAPKEDLLAQEIRSVDGRHSICAADLAEALMPFIEREFVSRDAVAELIEAAKCAIPFLRDEGAKYEDDGSNEPLEVARDLEAVIERIGGAE